MRINLSLKHIQLRLLFLNALHIDVPDEFLNAGRHLVEAISDIDKFIVPRKSDSFIKIPLLKRSNQIHNPLDLLARYTCN
ncbi:hypothetical protein D3C78_956180 [compost metagenome]